MLAPPQLPTRRFFLAVFRDSFVVVLSELSALTARPEGKLLRKVLDIVKFYLAFEIDEHSGQPLTEADVLKRHGMPPHAPTPYAPPRPYLTQHKTKQSWVGHAVQMGPSPSDYTSTATRRPGIVHSAIGMRTTHRTELLEALPCRCGHPRT